MDGQNGGAYPESAADCEELSAGDGDARLRGGVIAIAIAIAIAVTTLALVVLLSSLCLSCYWMVFNFFLALFMHNAHCLIHQHLVLQHAHLVLHCQHSPLLSHVISIHC